MAVTGALIAVAMTVTVQVVGWVALERKAVARRERALLEVENLLERIVARPLGRADRPSRRAELRISEATAGFLRSPTLDIKVTPFDDAPASEEGQRRDPLARPLRPGRGARPARRPGPIGEGGTPDDSYDGPATP